MNFENIAPSEWRWVAFLSGLLVTLTLIPYALALSIGDEAYSFMGILPNPKDGATYLSKIEQGQDGAWLFELRHTPQITDPAALHLIYLALGHVARLLGLSNVVIFHGVRVLASFFMFFSLYQLGATIWQRPRPRRLFFILSAMGTGVGWVGFLFSPEEFAPDLTVAEGFPWLAAYTNVHFPLALGCMAVLTAIYLTVFRPGFDEVPTSANGGLWVLGLSVLLAIIAPAALLVLGAVLLAYTLVQGRQKRALPFHEIRWTSMLVLPALPFAVYYGAVFRFNETMSDFNAQNVTPSPHPLLTLLGYAILLIIAAPGIWRAVKRFEPDGDQLMLLWLVTNSIAVYIPFDLQRRLFVGLFFPLVYFAVRAIEDFWLERLKSERRQRLAFLLVLSSFVPTHLITFGAPLILSVSLPEGGAETGILLQKDYVRAFDWLNRHAQRDEVVLASPIVGLWVPARTENRPVYGHEFETVPAEERLAQVRAFYQGTDCATLLDSDLPFRVSYVLWGEREDELGRVNSVADDIKPVYDEGLANDPPGDDTLSERPARADACKSVLEERASRRLDFGTVRLYVLPRP